MNQRNQYGPVLSIYTKTLFIIIVIHVWDTTKVFWPWTASFRFRYSGAFRYRILAYTSFNSLFDHDSLVNCTTAGGGYPSYSWASELVWNRIP
jgi:hypothetical protein